jgi:hypothetical protein
MKDISNKALNVDTDPINLKFKGSKITINDKESFYVPYNKKTPLEIKEEDIKIGKFEKRYAELDEVYNYPVLKILMDKVKEKYTDYKLYSEITKIYTNESIMNITRVNVRFYVNHEKKTINLTLCYPK